MASAGATGPDGPDDLLHRSLSALKQQRVQNHDAIQSVDRMLQAVLKAHQQSGADGEIQPEDRELIDQLWAQRQALLRLSRNLPVPARILQHVGPPSSPLSIPEGPEYKAPTSFQEVVDKRKEKLDALVNSRVNELHSSLPELPQNLKLHGLLETKKLQLLQLQRKLRGELLVEKWTTEDVQPTVLLDWSRLRRARMGAIVPEASRLVLQPPKQVLPVDVPTPGDVQRYKHLDEQRKIKILNIKQQEAALARQRQVEEENQRKRREEEERLRREREAKAAAVQQRQRFLGEVVNWSRDLRAYWTKQVPQRRQQRCSGIKAWHQREKARLSREQLARVQALKAHNYEEYLRLARTAKDERLRDLLNKTDQIMATLGRSVKAQRHHTASQAVQDQQDAGAGSEAVQTGEGARGGEVEMELYDGDSDDEQLDEAEKLIRRQHHYYDLVHHIKEEVRQPSMLEGGSLRAYQLDGLKFLTSLFNNKMNGILADEMGLGKTIQTVSYLAYLMESKNNKGPHLILAPKAVLSNWQAEFDKWTPSFGYVLYDGTPDERKILRQEKIDPGKFNVVLTHYDLAMRDKSVFKKVTWESLIVDEGHRLKNAESKLFEILSGYGFKQRLLLTGTPIQNSLTELWALLNFLLPKVFASSETFDEWFAAPFKSGPGDDVSNQLNEEEQLLVINRLHQVIRPFMLRRTKREVEKELPSKTEHIIKCDMSAWQRVLYQQVTQKGSIMLNGTSGKVRSLQNLSMHLRKVCIHPYLLTEDHVDIGTDPEELVRASGKLELLNRVLPKLQATGHRVLLFSQMTRALDMVQDFLELRGFKWLRLDGSTKTDDRGQMLQMFNAPDSPYFIFMLSTRAGGLGLNLQTADTVIMFDSDWNPAMDQQAEDRAHRIGQKKEVLVLILVAAGTIEEVILDKAHKKRDLDAKVIQAGMFNDKSTNIERQQALQALLRKGSASLSGTVHSEEEVNELLARSEEELRIFEEMDEKRREEAVAAGCCRPRLMTQDEVPRWLVEEPEGSSSEVSSSSDGEGEEGGKARRSRRARGRMVLYQDVLTDREFDKLMQEGATELDVAAMREKKVARKQRKLVKQAEAGEAARKAARQQQSQPPGSDDDSKPNGEDVDEAEEEEQEEGGASQHRSRKLRRLDSSRDVATAVAQQDGPGGEGDAEAGEEAAAAAVPVKRKRGRPPKARPPPEIAAPTPEPQADASGNRPPRARAPSRRASDAAEARGGHSEPASTGRGLRARRAGSAAAPSPGPTAPEASGAARGEPVPKRRGRPPGRGRGGRGRGGRAAVPAPTAVADGDEECVVVLPPPEDPGVYGRRSRSRSKSAVIEDSSGSQTSSEDSGDEGEEEDELMVEDSPAAQGQDQGSEEQEEQGKGSEGRGEEQEEEGKWIQAPDEHQQEDEVEEQPEQVMEAEEEQVLGAEGTEAEGTGTEDEDEQRDDEAEMDEVGEDMEEDNERDEDWDGGRGVVHCAQHMGAPQEVRRSSRSRSASRAASEEPGPAQAEPEALQPAMGRGLGHEEVVMQGLDDYEDDM